MIKAIIDGTIGHKYETVPGFKGLFYSLDNCAEEDSLPEEQSGIWTRKFPTALQEISVKSGWAQKNFEASQKELDHRMAVLQSIKTMPQETIGEKLNDEIRVGINTIEAYTKGGKLSKKPSRRQQKERRKNRRAWKSRLRYSRAPPGSGKASETSRMSMTPSGLQNSSNQRIRIRILSSYGWAGQSDLKEFTELDFSRNHVISGEIAWKSTLSQ